MKGEDEKCNPCQPGDESKERQTRTSRPRKRAETFNRRKGGTGGSNDIGNEDLAKPMVIKKGKRKKKARNRRLKDHRRGYLTFWCKGGKVESRGKSALTTNPLFRQVEVKKEGGMQNVPESKGVD